MIIPIILGVFRLEMRKISLITLLIGILLLFVTLLCFVISIYSPSSRLSSHTSFEEQYSTNIAQIVKLDEFKDQIRSDVNEQGLTGIEIPILIDEYVRNKFYHEYSVKPWNDNWVLAFVDLIVPQYLLSGNMRPTDIIQYDYGLCNQQAILFQELIKDFGYDYGSVRFNIPDFAHFASAVNVNGDWYFFDSNLEPIYDRTDPNIFYQIDAGNQQVLTRLYGDHFRNVTSEMIELSEINFFPASRGVLAQTIFLYISWYGWIFLLFPSAGFLFYKQNSKRRKGDDSY